MKNYLVYILIGIKISLFAGSWPGTILSGQWNKVDSISDHFKAKKELLRLKKNAKAWNLFDDFQFSKRIGHRYIFLGKFDSALVEINKAISLGDKLKEDSSLIYLYKIKANAHYYLRKGDEAIVYYQKALSIKTKKDYPLIKASIIANLGAMYVENNQGELAEKYLTRAISIFDSIGEYRSQANLMAQRVLALRYFLSDRVIKAKSLYRNLIRISREINDSIILTAALVFYSDVMEKTGFLDSAIIYNSEALQIQRKRKDFQSLMATLVHQTKHLEKKGDYKAAADCLHEVISIRDQVFKNEMANAASESEVKYKTKVLESEKEANKQALIFSEQKRNNLLLLIAVIIIVCVTLFLVYYLYQQKTRARLEKMKSEELIKAVIEGEEREKTRIARELHDGIVQEITLFKTNLKHICKTLPEENKMQLSSMVEKAGQIGDEVRNISHHMMPMALRQLGLIPALRDMLERVLPAYNIKYDFSEALITKRLPEQLEIGLYRMSQELVNNLTRHSNASYASLAVVERNGYITFIFEDNGKGFKPEENNKGTGISNLNSRVKMFNGEIRYESSLGEGTTVTIKIPLKNQ